MCAIPVGFSAFILTGFAYGNMSVTPVVGPLESGFGAAESFRMGFG
jgi:hypothetical protein